MATGHIVQQDAGVPRSKWKGQRWEDILAFGEIDRLKKLWEDGESVAQIRRRLFRDRGGSLIHITHADRLVRGREWAEDRVRAFFEDLSRGMERGGVVEKQLGADQQSEGGGA